MILHGRGIGGSTVHNTNLCKRAPDAVLRHWVSELGATGWSPEELAADYAAVESDLSVTPMTEDDVNRNNAIMRRGVQRLGWQGAVMAHNRRGCTRSGFCELGCSFNAKQNAQKILLPRALELGATVLCDMRVTGILRERDRATGVSGHVTRPDGTPGPEFTIRARAVCVCGSAISSAALLRHSDVPDPHRVAGRSLRLHPGVAVAGQFDELVEGWIGVPQSFECTEKLSLAPGASDRSWLIPAFAHPGGYAGIQPGFGQTHAAFMRAYPHTAVVAAMLHDETRGEVSADRHGRPKIRYELSREDAAALWRGVHAAAEILLAAGAKQVMVPLGTPLVARTVAELAPLLRHKYRPLDPLLTSVHPMGSLPLGSEGSITQPVRRLGTRPSGMTPACFATSSPQAPAAFTITGAVNAPPLLVSTDHVPLARPMRPVRLRNASTPPCARSCFRNPWCSVATSMSNASSSIAACTA